MKTSFNLDDYSGLYAMHCKTEDEANSFLEILHNAGRKWCNGESYAEKNYYATFKHHTLYYFNSGLYGSESFTNDGITILEWSDFIENENEISNEEFYDMLSKLLGI